MKADRVLVPLDGSSRAERALPVAIELLSERPGATLILMRAIGTAQALAAGAADGEVMAVDEAQSYLRALAERLRVGGFSRAVTTSVWYSRPERAITEAARTRRANVIVVSTQFPSDVRRSIQNAIATMKGPGTPMLLVPVDDADRDLLTAAA
jgi:nucleotide-binding universal stress UspA family protein